MARIAINYRRDDTSPWAGRLYDRLAAEFGRDHVFMDIDTLEPGVDFVEEITRAVGESHVLIAVIGPEWTTIRDPKGNRRLDNPMDFVRMEIAAALQRNIRVIPVLVGGAAMPVPADLPDDLAALARRHAIDISDLRFHADVDRLIRSVRLVLERLERSATRVSGRTATPAAAPRPSGGVTTPSAPPGSAQDKAEGPPPAAAGPPKVRGSPPDAAAARPKRRQERESETPVHPSPASPADAPADLLADLLGAGAPASRRWKQWLLLVASFWVAWAGWPGLLNGALAVEWLVRALWYPVAVVFSAVYCLSVVRSRPAAIAWAGVVAAVMANAYAPPPYIGMVVVGRPSQTSAWALGLVGLLALLALSLRRQWKVWLGLIVAVSLAAAFFDFVRFTEVSPEYASWWIRQGLNRALWPILLLSALALVVPRFRSRFRGILLAVVVASVLADLLQRLW